MLDTLTCDSAILLDRLHHKRSKVTTPVSVPATLVQMEGIATIQQASSHLFLVSRMHSVRQWHKERGFQWQAALGLLQESAWQKHIFVGSHAHLPSCMGHLWPEEMVSVHLQPDVVSFNAAVSACDTGQQWQLALRVYDHMEQAKGADVGLSFVEDTPFVWS